MKGSIGKWVVGKPGLPLGGLTSAGAQVPQAFPLTAASETAASLTRRPSTTAKMYLQKKER